MTHSSSGGAFVFVRWLAVVAILLTFLGPFGTSAQGIRGEASPVPPEETVTVDPTAEPTEPVNATETPTEEAGATETPTSTAAATETPDGTPTEESEFSASGVTDNGFTAPS